MLESKKKKMFESKNYGFCDIKFKRIIINFYNLEVIIMQRTFF